MCHDLSHRLVRKCHVQLLVDGRLSHPYLDHQTSVYQVDHQLTVALLHQSWSQQQFEMEQNHQFQQQVGRQWKCQPVNVHGQYMHIGFILYVFMALIDTVWSK